MIKISITMKYKNKYTNNQNNDKIYLSNINCFIIKKYQGEITMFNEFDAIPPEDQYIDDFDINIKTGDVKLKPTASKEAIQCYLRNKYDRFNAKDIVYSPTLLSNKMIEDFKKLDCYKAKSDAEREEIIQYLKDNPDIEDDNPNIFIYWKYNFILKF